MLIDTNVLVAALVEAHPDHGPSAHFLTKMRRRKSSAALCVHSLAEFYAVMTALPHHPPIHPDQAHQMVQKNILGHFDIITLGAKDYQLALERSSSKALRSGAIFDALIVQAAIKKNISHLVTWNKKDFIRLTHEEFQIVTPDEINNA